MRNEHEAGMASSDRPIRVPTSEHIGRMVEGTTETSVSVGWIVEQLGERSFGVTLLLMALLGLVPGASTFVGLLIAWPAIQMMMGYHSPVLPGFFARRRIRVEKLERAIGIISPRLRWVEKLIRPRWQRGFMAARWLTGIVMLLLGLTMISPFPFSHVIPAFVIMLLALAYLEEDGFVLLIALAAALTSMAITVAALWGAAETAGWLDRLLAGG